MAVKIECFFHADTSTLSYIVYDQIGGHGVIIDSALDFAANSGKIYTTFADQQLAFIEQNQLQIDWILETHAHADHLSAADYLKSKLNAKVGVGRGITTVQSTFKHAFNITDDELNTNGDVFDRLFDDNEIFQFGAVQCQVITTPGHTSDSVSYIIENNAFVGDTLFMPDGGTARCDFPGGDAAILYDSICRLHQLPDDTKLWVCHDYQPGGRELASHTTAKLSRQENIHVGRGKTKADFVHTRQTRDSGLDVPRLLYPAVQINIRGGRLPVAEANGTRFVKIPLTFNP